MAVDFTPYDGTTATAMNGYGRVVWTGTSFVKVGSLPAQRSVTGAEGDWAGVGFYEAEDAAAGAGAVVMVGLDIDNPVRRSVDDGLTWTTYLGGGSVQFFRVIFAAGLFYALGAGSASRTSPNGSTWTIRTRPFTQVGDALAHGNSLFMSTSSTHFWTSGDGTTWTQRGARSLITGTLIPESLTFWQDRFVVHSYTAVGSVYTLTVWWSLDGITWTGQVVPAAFQASGFLFVAGTRLFVTPGARQGSPANGTTLVEVLDLDAPEFDDPVELPLGSWGKGETDGENIIMFPMYPSTVDMAIAPYVDPTPPGPVSEFWTGFVNTYEVP